MARNEETLPKEGSIEDVYRRLEIWGKRTSHGFVRVEYFSEFARMQVVNRLRADLEQEQIPLHEIHLPSDVPHMEYIWAYRDKLKDLSPGMVSVTGFPNPLLCEYPIEHYIAVLDFNRENLAVEGLCQIWWMSSDFIDKLIHLAPDLDSWFMLRLKLTEIIKPTYELQSFMQPLEMPTLPLEEARNRAEYLTERFKNAIRQNAPAGDILSQLIVPAVKGLHDAGDHPAAKELAAWMLDQLSEKDLQQEGDIDGWNNVNNLANIYKSQGNYKKAESLNKKALEIAKRMWGDEHVNVAMCLNNLANNYIDQGNYEEAERLYKRAIEIGEKTLDADHPNLASGYNNLAGLYQSQGKYEEAERLYKRARGIDEKVFGPDHPNMAILYNNLAELYRSQGKYEEAERLYKRAKEIDEKALGPNHPDLARVYNNLALLYDSQGKYAEAERLYKRAIGIAEKALPSDHPNLATLYENYSRLLRDLNRVEEAAQYEAKARAIRERRGESEST